MTYSEFVQTFTNGCSLIFNNLGVMCESLIHNYIFLTILGLVVVVSLFWFLYDWIFDDVINANIDKLIDKQNLYDRYDEFRKMRYEWNINNMHFNEMEAVNRYQINRNAFNLVFGQDKNKYDNKPVIPDWLDKDIVLQKPSDSEQAELDELLKNF